MSKWEDRNHMRVLRFGEGSLVVYQIGGNWVYNCFVGLRGEERIGKVDGSLEDAKRLAVIEVQKLLTRMLVNLGEAARD